MELTKDELYNLKMLLKVELEDSIVLINKADLNDAAELRVYKDSIQSILNKVDAELK